MNITQDELDSILKKHALWIGGELGGFRADLSWSNLSGCDLRGCDLSGCNLRGEIISKPPMQIDGIQWSVTITEEFLEIGCQRHTHDEWRAFSEEQIAAFHGDAWSFWQKHKSSLLGLCDAHSTAEDRDRRKKMG